MVCSEWYREWFRTRCREWCWEWCREWCRYRGWRDGNSECRRGVDAVGGVGFGAGAEDGVGSGVGAADGVGRVGSYSTIMEASGVGGAGS